MLDRKKSITDNGKRIKGQGYLLRHLDGKAVTRNQAILAKCYDCMGYYADGPQDCEIPACPLYRFMPFREQKIESFNSDIPGEREAGIWKDKNPRKCATDRTGLALPQ